MNSPWECPRCGRMNSPYNPSCFCKRDDEKELIDLAKKVAKPLYTFKEVEEYMKNSRCTTCGGYHGIFQGRAIQCVDLQHRITPGIAGQA